MRKFCAIGIVSLLVIGSFFGVVNLVSENASAGPWHLEIVDPLLKGWPSIALDSNGDPHISYTDGSDMLNPVLKYAKKTGGTWSMEIVEYVSIDEGTSIALDTFDNPHISYFDWTSRILKHAEKIGSTWYIEVVDSAYEVGRFSSIAIDQLNNIHISYMDASNKDLKYAKKIGSGWNLETVDWVDMVGWSTSIALDKNGNPHISYCAIPHTLKYAKKIGGSWSIEPVDSVGPGLEFYPTSIDIDSYDYPHITYIYRPGTYWDLKYARWMGSFWSIDIVTSGILEKQSMELDSNDNPHISYGELISNELKRAKLTPSGWNFETVDTDGSYPSIALDVCDKAHISYIFFPAMDLKYAKEICEEWGWTNEDPDPPKPLGLYEHAMAYDSESKVVILFGGITSTGYTDETWAYDYDTNEWTNMNPSTRPQARARHAMAYDSESDMVILFGGTTSTGYNDETWAYDYDTNSWKNKNPSKNPSARADHAMVYHSEIDWVLLFGGITSLGYSAETLLYDFNSNAWAAVNVVPPSARAEHAMAYDSESEMVILFGGVNEGGVNGETWAYDNDAGTWTNMNPTPTPSARRAHAMAYDSESDMVILFGGWTSNFNDETWAYDYDTNEWTNMNPDIKPSARYGHAMAYDSENDRTILFGGMTGLGINDETWSYHHPNP